MKKIILTALLATMAVPLTSCETTSPAPLEQTSIDEVALETAWRSFDAVLDAVNLLIDTGVIEPTSESAVRMASNIDAATAALEAAESAVDAGEAASFGEAMENAQRAIVGIRWALRQVRGAPDFIEKFPDAPNPIEQ